MYRLATLPTADGVLLASGDTDGGVLLWDAGTGAHVAGPVTVDSVHVADLAAVDLGADGWALACAGSDGVTLWDPLRMGRPDYEPRRLLDTGASELAVIPGEPHLIVLADAKAVRVLDPASGRQLFDFRQPHPKGHVGDQVHRLVGVHLDDGTAGFAAARYGGGLEVWAPGGSGWHQGPFSIMAPSPGDFTAYGTRLAVPFRRCIDVWDLETGERTARGELDTPYDVLAPVPLGGRTVIAAAFREYDECGVQLWDPQHPTALSAPFNQHGSAFGDPSFGSARINDVVGISCPDGTTRVASAGNDGCVLISAPVGEDDLVAGQRPGPAPARRDDGDYAKVRTSDGEIVGLWFADTERARDQGLIEAFLFAEDLAHLLGAEYRVVPNTYDDRGGAFVMFGRHFAPGEDRRA
ncbi:WD40 repeat domain-containing protein [Streptomyces sp. 4N124]|uniref:WD40 repeat domain-containing protein n=1 Tax=Streptomyces sp. 4N124 TaxID=3457420 RepID=UPI003FD3A79E